MNIQAFYKALARVLSEKTETEIIDIGSVGDEVYVKVLIMLNGLDIYKDYDYMFAFYMSERANDLKAMNECKSILKNLLAEEQ